MAPGDASMERGEGRFVAHAVGVVAGCDEQRRGDVWADAAGAQQSGVGVLAELEQLGVELGDLAGEGLVAAR